MEFQICLDYLKFCNLSYREKESVLDWYAKSIGLDFVDLNISNFFNSNLKRKLVVGDIHVSKSKNNTYNIVVAGMSCRGLLENLNTLLKEINPECLTRIDVKIIEDCNMSVDDIIVQHQFLKHDKSSNWIKVDSRLGITSYTKFFGGKVRVYNYYDLNETGFELQFDKKECLIKIRDYLINDKIEDLKNFFEDFMSKELIKLPRNFELVTRENDYSSDEEQKENPALHLTVNLLCGDYSCVEKANLIVTDDLIEVKEGNVEIEAFFSKDAGLLFYFLYALYKIQQKKASFRQIVCFHIKEYFDFYDMEDSRRNRDIFQESLLSLFNLGFVFSNGKKTSLTRFIYRITGLKNRNFEIELNSDVFVRSEIINTPFNMEDLKDYWKEIKENNRVINTNGKLSFDLAKQSFLISMALGSFTMEMPLSIPKRSSQRKIFESKVIDQLSFYREKGKIFSFSSEYEDKNWIVKVDSPIRSNPIKLVFKEKKKENDEID